MSSLTQARLRELLDYDPITGTFIRRIAAGGVAAGAIVGSKDSEGYLLIRVDGERHRAHRLAFLWMDGSLPSGRVDHANMRRDDNAWANLRPASAAQNRANGLAWQGKKLQIKGVYERAGKFRAAVCKDGKLIHLGTFDTAEAAQRVYANAAAKLFGQFARVE